MADLSTPARADDTTPPVNEPLYGAAADTIRDHLREPSDLDVAISVARQLLDSDQILSLREALRLLLRALDTTPRDTLPSTAHSPLRDYAVDLISLDLDTEARMAGEVLAETDTANIHAHDEMINAAVVLSMRLRTLTTALATEAGERR